MKLAVFSHKPCWPSATSPSGYATDGGFPLQMRALSELFDATTLIVPVNDQLNRDGEVELTGRALNVTPLALPAGADFRRKLNLLPWLVRHLPILWRSAREADAIHVPIPGDIGTLGMALAWLLGKPLCVRYCGNWFATHTTAERLWKWWMERFAGGRNLMLATGGASEPPSRNPHVRWIFSTSLTQHELDELAHPRQFADARAARLIIVCRQERGKGTDLVIEALAQLQNEFPRLSFAVIGDGGGLSYFKECAARRGVSDRVSFHGKLDHAGVLRELRQADLFCYPTESEGFPKAVLEALACGLPVITTRVSMLPQLVANAGVLLDEVSAQAFAETLRALLLSCTAQPERYRALSEQAFATAQNYSLEKWRDTIGGWMRAAWGARLSNI